MKYGVQLYSLREMAQEKGMEAILKTVADAGYQGVEFAGFHGCSPEEIKSLLEKYNLVAVAAHIPAEFVEENINYIKTLNLKVVYTAGVWGEGWLDENYPETVRRHKKALDFLNSNGVEFGYHNHSHEYVDGNDFVKKLTDDVDGMKIELDLCWVTHAGRNAVEKMREYKGKLKTVHIKELPKGDPHCPPPLVGEGLVDMRGAFEEAKAQGLEWGILEVEQFDMPEIDYLSKSLKNIRKIEKGESL